MTNRGKKPTNKFISDRLHEEKAILDRQQEEEREKKERKRRREEEREHFLKLKFDIAADSVKSL